MTGDKKDGFRSLFLDLGDSDRHRQHCPALLFGVWPRLAATLEAAMLALIAITYWGPDLYTGRPATTAFIISFLITGGVWLVAYTYRGVPWLSAGWPVWKSSDVEFRTRKAARVAPMK